MHLPNVFYPVFAAGFTLILALPWIGGFSLFQHYHGLLQAMPAQDFTLDDRSDAPVTLSQLTNKPVFLSFGYQHCQQSCPTQRAIMLQLAAKLRQQAHIVWISLTPEADKLTASSASAPILELFPKTTHEALKLAAAYRQKTSPGANSGHNPDHNDYIYLIDTSNTVRLLYQSSKVSTSSIVEDFYKLSP